MDDFDEALGDEGRVIASCDETFSDEKGRNPPHLRARRRYEEIVADGHFVCTHEYGAPVSFRVDAEGCTLEEAETTKTQDERNTPKKTAADAVRAARGTTAPPVQEVGFGNR